MKGGKYAKTLPMIWVEGIIRRRDIRGNVLPKFIERMETPCYERAMSSNMADKNRQKHLLPIFATKA